MRYKVVGSHTVAGVQPGRTVTIDDPVQARQLERGGHIAPIVAPPRAATYGGDK